MRLLSIYLLFISLVSAQVGGPSLTVPDNGATEIDEASSITLNWSGIINVGYYEYEVDVSTSFSSPIVDGTTSASIYYIPSNTLSGSTTYYWRVRGQHTSGPWNGYPTSWSSTHSFTSSFPYDGPVWYISPNGSEFAEGTEGNPLNNFFNAHQKTNPGDTIYVMPGTYTGEYNQGISNSQDEHHLTIIGTGSVDETIFELTDTFISFSNLSNGNIQNISFTTNGSMLNPYAIFVGNNGQSTLALDNCKFFNIQGKSVFINHNAIGIINNCVFSGNTSTETPNRGGSSFYVGENTQLNISNSLFYDNND